MRSRRNNENHLRAMTERFFAGARHLLAPVCFLVAFFASGALQAQIEIRVVLEHRAYLVGEPFAVRVQIENQLAVPMVFDSEYHNAELLVELVRTRSGSLPESERRPVVRDLVIMPGQKALELVEVTSLFSLRMTGGYKVRAAIRYEGRLYLSQPVELDLVRGVELVSARRTLSGYTGTDLVYSLRYWKRSGGEHAFFVIEDAESGVVYGTFFLGPIIRVNPPAIQFDERGRAIAVHQSGRNRFTRSTFEVDRNGANLTEQTHHLADGRLYPERPVSQ